MLLGPAYRQVLGGGEEAIRRWTMFHGIGSKLCRVSFLRRHADGSDEPLDGAAWLDVAAPALRVTSEKKALALGRRICARLPEGSDLRVELRCPGKRGWETRPTGETNACAGHT
jgi:hypothetical protein